MRAEFNCELLHLIFNILPTIKMLWLLFAESLSSAWPFSMGCPAALDEATMKKGHAKAVFGSNGNGSEQQGPHGSTLWRMNL